jgi:hypothetical protein
VPLAAPLAAQPRRVAMTTADSADFDLDRYRWRSRVVVLLAPSAATPEHAEQRASLAVAAEALRARDMVVVSVFADGSGTVEGRPLAPGAATRLRRRLRAPADGLTVLLVGKDGGTKLRRRAPVRPDDLFALVDGMPMGRVEARRRG